MHHLTQAEWVAIAAHRLQHRWHSINPVQLDEVATELWGNAHLRELEPKHAADAWLDPILLKQTGPDLPTCQQNQTRDGMPSSSIE